MSAKSKRMRVFAGPNGSGKTSLFEKFKGLYHPGCFINADQLEKQLNEEGVIDLDFTGIEIGQEDLDHFSGSETAQSLLRKAKSMDMEINFRFENHRLISGNKTSHGYEASFIAAFIRDQLTRNNVSFSFETVMSHPAKLQEIAAAKALGYRTYLYFICTSDPDINVSRVKNRVKKGGHAVSVSKIRDRYLHTLDNLVGAAKLVNRAYLFDNSEKTQKLVLEVQDGEYIQIHSPAIPVWIEQYFFGRFLSS